MDVEASLEEAEASLEEAEASLVEAEASLVYCFSALQGGYSTEASWRETWEDFFSHYREAAVEASWRETWDEAETSWDEAGVVEESADDAAVVAFAVSDASAEVKGGRRSVSERVELWKLLDFFDRSKLSCKDGE